MTATDQEQAVRNYLTFLTDPESLRDEGAIQELEDRLDDTDDQIEQLRIHDQLAVLRDLPESAFLQPFIENALEWANKQGLSASSFLEMGVQRKVLREAGFEVSGSVKRRTVEEVREWIADQGLTEFTKSALVEGTGASPATVTRAVVAMIEDGEIVLTDRDDPNHSGRGAKAKLFELIN